MAYFHLLLLLLKLLIVLGRRIHTLRVSVNLIVLEVALCCLPEVFIWSVALFLHVFLSWGAEIVVRDWVELLLAVLAVLEIIVLVVLIICQGLSDILFVFFFILSYVKIRFRKEVESFINENLFHFLHNLIFSKLFGKTQNIGTPFSHTQLLTKPIK